MINPRKMRYVLQLCDTLMLIKTEPLSVLVSNCFVPRENTLFSIFFKGGQLSADKMAAYFFALKEVVVNLSLVFCSV